MAVLLLASKRKRLYTNVLSPEEPTMRRFTLSVFLLAVIVLIGGSFGELSAQTSAKKTFTFEDMMALKRVGGPVISPNGKWVMYSAMDVDLQKNTKTTHLWFMPLAGGEA